MVTNMVIMVIILVYECTVAVWYTKMSYEQIGLLPSRSITSDLNHFLVLGTSQILSMGSFKTIT